MQAPFQATLFFLNASTRTLKPAVAEVPPYTIRSEGILHLLETYLATEPAKPLVHPLPRDLTPTTAFFPEPHICVLNFSFPSDGAFAMGSSEEKMLVYALVNTVALNFPDIKAVKILINGAEPTTLFHHMDPTAFYRPTLTP